MTISRKDLLRVISEHDRLRRARFATEREERKKDGTVLVPVTRWQRKKARNAWLRQLELRQLDT